jgi:dUTP pyrophosphatase
MTLIYFAEPIDQACSTAYGPLRTLANAVHEDLRGTGCVIYRPRTALYTSVLDPRVDRLNRVWLYQADVLVAILPAGVPSIGVPAEIEAATARGIPAVVIHDGASQSLTANPLVTICPDQHAVVDAVAHAIREHPRPEADETIRMVIRDGGEAPRRVYADDAGIDLNTAIGVTLEPYGYADIRTQVDAVELPPGYWGLVTGRSSTIRQRRIHVPTGVIDPGWRGALFVGAYNLTDQPVVVKVGDRLGQLILIPAIPAPVQVVGAVSDHQRGLNGFGSSGE